MKSLALYSQAQEQLKEGKPFVLYRKPKSNLLESYFQNDTSLNFTDNYTTQGFVMAPFDVKQKAIVFPLIKCTKDQGQIVSENNVVNNKVANDLLASETASNKHVALVKLCVQTINEGRFDKVVVSREECVAVTNKDWIAVFDKLLGYYPTAFVYLWYHPKVGLWLGATPETLLSIKNDMLSTMALAATQPYHGNMQVNWSLKEQNEQQIVTDFIHETLQPWAKEIKVSQAYAHQAGNLLHLRSDINATIDFTKVKLKDILQKIHPTPAVCGLPKEAALKFIKNNEGYNRTFYTGFLGEILIEKHKNIDANLYVNLRCMQIFEEEIKIYVGGGITRDSNPEKEWEETVRKTHTMKKVL